MNKQQAQTIHNTMHQIDELIRVNNVVETSKTENDEDDNWQDIESEVKQILVYTSRVIDCLEKMKILEEE